MHLLTFDEIQRRTGFRRTQLYRWMAEGSFPKPVKFGRASRWVSVEVEEWIQAAVSARHQHVETS